MRNPFGAKGIFRRMFRKIGEARKASITRRQKGANALVRAVVGGRNLTIDPKELDILGPLPRKDLLAIAQEISKPRSVRDQSGRNISPTRQTILNGCIAYHKLPANQKPRRLEEYLDYYILNHP